MLQNPRKPQPQAGAALFCLVLGAPMSDKNQSARETGMFRKSRANLVPGADGQANYSLGVLREKATEGPLSHATRFIEGFSLKADPLLKMAGHYTSPKGRLLDLSAKPGSDQGNWCALHLSLPAQSLTEDSLIGFVARISAPEIAVARVCLRSQTPEGFSDSFFDKHMLFRPEDSTHMDVQQAHYSEDIPARAEWRELVFFLPTDAFELSLIDLRVFVI